MGSKMKKALVLLLTLALCLGVVSAQAAIATQAATAQRDGIEVTLTTDKSEYAENEKINVTLEIVNTTDKDIAPVAVNYTIPNTCMIDGEAGSYVEKIDVLKSGEKITVTRTLSVVQPTVAEDMNLPSTGDGSNIFLWVMLAAASVFALSRMGRQNLKRLFAIVLCISMMTSMLPVGTSRALAEEDRFKINPDATSGVRVPLVLDDESLEKLAEESDVISRSAGTNEEGELPLQDVESVSSEFEEPRAFDNVEILTFEEDVKRSLEFLNKSVEESGGNPEKEAELKEMSAAVEMSISGSIALSAPIVVMDNEEEVSVSISYGTSAVGLPAASFKTISTNPLWHTKTPYTKEKYDKTIKSGVALPKSGHKYKNNLDEVYRLKGGNGCYGMTVFFDSKSEFENNYDGLVIYDGNEEYYAKFTGNLKYDYFTIGIDDGDEFTNGVILRMLTDGSVNEYGFQVTKAIPHTMPEIKSIAIVNGDGHVKLTWKKLFGYTGYVILRAEVNGSSVGDYSVISSVSNSKATSFTDITVERGKTYEYRMLQVYQVGNEYVTGLMPSHAATISIPAELPAPNTDDIWINSLSASKVQVNWEPVNGATGYAIYTSKSYDAADKLVTRVNGKNYATVSVPRTGGLSYYRVQPYIKVGSYYFYGQKSAKVKNFALGVPSGVKGEKLDIGEYRVTWKKVSNAHEYYLAWSNEKNGTYQLAKNTDGELISTEGTSMTVYGLDSFEKDVYFRVCAVRWDGTSASMSALSSPVRYTNDFPTYRAFFVGNTYPGTNNYLPGPDNDVDAMRSMIARQSGTPTQVTYGYNLSASTIQSTIKSAFAGADSSDISIFYYSGHGASNGSLCGVKNTYVSVNQLRSWLDKVPGKKIVLLDSCHSGTHIGKSADGEDFDPEAFNDAVIAAFAATPKANLANSNYYVLTACSKNEYSFSYGSGSSAYGLFTSGLTKGSGYDMRNQVNCNWYADTNSNGEVTLKEAYNYIVQTVNNSTVHQSTKYHGPDSAVLWKRY